MQMGLGVVYLVELSVGNVSYLDGDVERTMYVGICQHNQGYGRISTYSARVRITASVWGWMPSSTTNVLRFLKTGRTVTEGKQLNGTYTHHQYVTNR
jgi:hypothetical protein